MLLTHPPTTSTSCPTCGGYGWKYVTPKADLQTMATHCAGTGIRQRRTCPTCRGASASTDVTSMSA